jgi:hypothetical protein
MMTNPAAYVFHGPLKHNPKNPRYFTDESGEAIYLTGSHTWAVMQDMWAENEPRLDTDYDGFLRMMEDHRHNFLRFWQFALYTKNCPWNTIPTCFDPMPFERTGPDIARDGLSKFDLTKPSAAYFDRLRQRVQKAAMRGIYVSIMMFDAWGIKCATPSQQPWDYHVFNPDNHVNRLQVPTAEVSGLFRGNYIGIYTLHCPDVVDVQKRFIRWVIDAVNDLDNVLFEICNEIPNTPESMAWQSHLCNYIREYEKGKPKQHMIGITPEGGNGIMADLLQTPADWISPSNGRGFEYRYNPPAATGEKVLLNDTDHLWGHGCDIGWIWKSFTRGMNVLFMDPWEPIPGDLDWWQEGDISRNQRYFYAWDDARRNLGYARSIALRFDLNNCIPDTNFCTSTFSLANHNEQYVCFFPAGGYEGLDLTGLDGEFRVEWLNPATGVTSMGEPIQARVASPHEVYQRTVLRAPFEGAAVLLVYKHARVLPRPRNIFLP